MGYDVEPPRVAIQLLPDWTASSVDPLLARLDAVIKIPRGSLLEEGSLQLLLLDEEQRVLTAKSTPLNLGGKGQTAGPAWKVVRGGLIKMSDASTHACAVLNDVRSAPVARLDGRVPVLLHAIDRQVGVPGEPHLWWRFYNHTAMSIPVDRVFSTTTLQIDDRMFSPAVASYDGPAHLPSHRALSGLWSLDEFDARARTGPHRFRLSILGATSGPFVFDWEPPF